MFNKSPIPYKITLDFSQSKNLLFSAKTSKIEKIVNASQYEFFLHFYLLADDFGTKSIDSGYNIFFTPLK